MSFESDQERLRTWFNETKRSFPWREEITPYKVLVSEIMLQQTRADVVIEYFNRWIRLFPTLESLKQSPVDIILKAFEGLGYYSRARNLHKAAHVLAEHFPANYDELIRIPGIGPYTADAICSFAFQQKKIAMDANVQRVLSRYYASHDVKECKKRAEQSLTDDRPYQIAEALIELGATLCGKKPDCSSCPLNHGCKAYKLGQTDLFPLKKIRQQTTICYKKVTIFQFENMYGIRTCGEGELFQGLSTFHETQVDESAFLKLVADSTQTSFKPVTATATNFRFKLIAQLQVVENRVDGLEFLPVEKLVQKTFNSGHKKILLQFLGAHTV
jgi:A/G-specific adenine glycosylase